MTSGILMDLDVVPDGVVAYDVETGKIRDINRTLCERLGYTAGTLRGRDITVLGVSATPVSAEEWQLQQANTDDSIWTTWRLETSDGNEVRTDVRLTTTTQDGETIVVASIRELPDCDRYRQADQYTPLVEKSPIIVWELDLAAARAYATSLAERTDDLVTYLRGHSAEMERILDRVTVRNVNETAVEFYGASSKEELVTNLDQLLTDKALDMWCELCGWLLAEESRFRTECVAATLDGDTKTLLFEAFRPDDRADDYSQVYMTGINISERKRREQELEAAHDARQALQESLAATTSVDAFADGVCSALTALDDIPFARIAVGNPTGTLDTLATSDTEHHRDEVNVPDDDVHPALAAFRDGKRRRIQITKDHEQEGDGQTVGEIVAEPVVHDGVARGVLVVHLTAQRVLQNARLCDLLAESAAVLGHAIESEKRRRALAAEDAVELTVEIDTETSPLVRAADAAAVTMTITAAIPRDETSVLCYLTGKNRDAFVDAARDTDGLDQVRPVASNSSRIQLVTTEPVPNTVIADQGGNVIEATVGPERMTLTARFPRGTAYESVTEALGTHFESVTTTEYTSVPDATDDSEPPLGELTNRQQELLEAAVHAGYFEYPRDQTATEMADTLGISRQTFDEIIRAAQRNLLTALFSDR